LSASFVIHSVTSKESNSSIEGETKMFHMVSYQLLQAIARLLSADIEEYTLVQTDFCLDLKGL
jgi:hypothetical protein